MRHTNHINRRRMGTAILLSLSLVLTSNGALLSGTETPPPDDANWGLIGENHLTVRGAYEDPPPTAH